MIYSREQIELALARGHLVNLRDAGAEETSTAWTAAMQDCRAAEDAVLLWARRNLRRLPEYGLNERTLNQLLGPSCPVALRSAVIEQVAWLQFHPEALALKAAA